MKRVTPYCRRLCKQLVNYEITLCSELSKTFFFLFFLMVTYPILVEYFCFQAFDYSILAVIYYVWGGGLEGGGGEWERLRGFILFNWLLFCLHCLWFFFLLFNASVWCFTRCCWPKWAVSVLEWLSERLLGQMSGTFLNLGIIDLSCAYMRCVCLAVWGGGVRPTDSWKGEMFDFIILSYVCMLFLLVIFCSRKANFCVTYKESVSVSASSWTFDL